MNTYWDSFDCEIQCEEVYTISSNFCEENEGYEFQTFNDSDGPLD